MDANNTRFMRRLVFSYSALLIIILIMGIYMYNISIKNARFEIRNQNKLMLQNAIDEMDDDFITMDSLAGQVASDSNIVRLANKSDNSDNDFYLMAYKAKNNLSVYIYTESLLPINTYYIYLKQPGYILSFSQFQDTSFYYYEKKYIQDMYSEWLDMMNNSAFYRKFNPLQYHKNMTSPAYLYILPLKNYSFRNIPATICFEIDHQGLVQTFSELNLFETGYLCVTDKEGEIIFTLTDEQAGDISPETLMNLTYDNEFSQYGLSDNKMFVTSTISDYNEWNYFLVQPVDASLYSLAQYRDIFTLIICTALILEFILIFILSKTNVKPIIQLGNELQDTISQQKSLQKIVETQKPIIQHSYLNRMMQGDISTQKELDYAQNYLNISTENRKFSVLYMIVYINQYELYVEDSAITGPNTENYDDIIQSALQQFFESSIHILSSSDRAYTLLLSGPAEEPITMSTSLVKEAFTNLHEHLMSNFSIWTFAGLGDWNNGLMITWNSYQQATQAVSYATKRHIFHCYANIKREANVFYYPIELTRQLTNFIISGNESQILEIFEIIRLENMEKRSLPINMMKCLLSDIHNTLYKIRFTLETVDKNADELKAVDARFNSHKSLKLCEDIAVSLCRLFTNKSSENQLITTIKDYIKENYKDPSLCLNKISDEFSISESYFSFLFKEETGENFSIHLERTRMEQAIQLIKETNVNISDLYHEVGYNNSNTFRRAFKKTYGLSPKKVKDLNQTL